MLNPACIMKDLIPELTPPSLCGCFCTEPVLAANWPSLALIHREEGKRGKTINIGPIRIATKGTLSCLILSDQSDRTGSQKTH